MAGRLTDDQRIEMYFQHCSEDDALRQLKLIELILRTRGIGNVPPKRGRPRKKREKPPLIEQEASNE